MSDRDRFVDLFDSLSPRVYLYARRHCDAATAQDVVAETFLVAWRRINDVPVDSMPWLLAVARNVISNRFRGELRQARLVEAIGHIERIASDAPAADEWITDRAALIEALAQLSAAEREALLLVGWDGCTTREAAAVVGCSPRAFEVRLSRARARLARSIANQQDEDDPDRRPRPPQHDADADGHPTTTRDR